MLGIYTKTTERGRWKEEKGENGIQWAASAMKGGSRPTMEDAYIVQEITTVEDPQTGDCIELREPHYFFAVLDGHAGSMAAEFTKEHLCSLFQQRPEFIQYAQSVAKDTQDVETTAPTDPPKSPDSDTQSPGTKRPRLDFYTVCDDFILLQRAFEDAFVEMDLKLLKEMVDQGIFKLPPDPATLKSTKQAKKSASDEDNNQNDIHGGQVPDSQAEEESPGNLHTKNKPPETSGTTVTAVLVTPYLVACANLGDCRTIIDGRPRTTDHTPCLPSEKKRIVEAKGEVKYGRVDGELAMSRALGDFDNGFKNYNQSHLVEGNMDMDQKRILAQKQKVSPFPQVKLHVRFAREETLILASDGVWEIMSNEECDQFVKTKCNRGVLDVGWIAEKLLDDCEDRFGSDNKTIVIALLS